MLDADMVKVCNVQSDIITMQSEIIDALFMRLAQNIEMEDLFSMPEIDKMNKVVEMRESIGEEMLEEADRHG